MKRIYFILWLCLVSGIIAAQSTKELHLFHTNDMHSRIEPFPEEYQDTLLAGKAGMIRRATLGISRKVHLIIIYSRGKWKSS